MIEPEAIAPALRAALLGHVLGIEQADAVLAEDGSTIMLYGHTSDPDVTYVATFPVPPVTWKRA